MRVFLCSTHRDLATERLLVQQSLESLVREAEGLSFFAPRSQPTLDASLAALRNSDLAVFLLGHSYGAMAPGLQFSHAEREYQEAAALGIPILTFVRRLDFGMLPGQFEREPARVAKQREFRALLESCQCLEFTDAPTLAQTVRRTLESEIALRGLPRRFPTRSIPKIGLNTPTAPHSPSTRIEVPQPGNPVPLPSHEAPGRTLPGLEQALRIPYSQNRSGKMLWWILGGAAVLAAALVTFLVFRGG